jgi:hypothetical protein
MKLTMIRDTKAACFLSYMEDRSKDKHIHKNKQGKQVQVLKCSPLSFAKWGNEACLAAEP